MSKHLNTMRPRLIVFERDSYNSKWLSILHSHVYAEFFYVLNGSGLMEFENEAINVNKGDLVIVDAFVQHTEKSSVEGGLEYLVLGFEGVIFQKKDGLITNGYFHWKSKNPNHFKDYIQLMIKENLSPTPYTQHVLNFLLSCLIAKALETSKDYMEVSNQENRDSSTCLYISDYIEKNYRRDITLDSLALISHYSKYHLSHIFKNFHGISPINYMLNCRIKEACILLETTNLAVKDISEIIGFKNATHFTTYFKKSQKMSPSKFRKNAPHEAKIR